RWTTSSRWESKASRRFGRWTLLHAVHLDDEAAPAWLLAAAHAERTGRRAAATEHPGRKPGFDFRWQMADQVPGGQVHPHPGLLLHRRTGDQEQLVAGVNLGQMTRAGAENGAVDGGAEACGPPGRKRWWWAAQHVFKLPSVKTARHGRRSAHERLPVKRRPCGPDLPRSCRDDADAQRGARGDAAVPG